MKAGRRTKQAREETRLQFASEGGDWSAVQPSDMMGSDMMGLLRSVVCVAIAAAWMRFAAVAAASWRKGDDLESPQYSLVHSESDFEIRKYNNTVWITAHEDDTSFTVGTYKGFHKLFQYIEGANLNSSRVPMTSPIMTGIVPSFGPSHSFAFIVRLYVPAAFQKSPPVALPELNLKVERLGEQCIAVRKFSGFARDSNIAKEVAKLSLSLKESPWKYTFSEKPAIGHDAYSIAQYRRPFQIFFRVNEVWVALTNLVTDDCLPKRSLQDTIHHESI
ncbi:hypothetical protein O6H91_01G072000 [Diphasiastrum complanatum]|uniref:Uncharacterized protein n=1 Tax=Diphasiastrum complanatum TaxID=34168 RepID=A0ACC2ES94_DIPCM|nr:hypothetical protein O6H91_01G072000 [Diphasiastrum complanatum]